MLTGSQKILYIALGLLGVVLFVLSLVVLNAYLKNRKYERAYNEIKIGDSEEAVVLTMGKPDRVDICRNVSSPNDSAEDKKYQQQCAVQFWYESFLKPYLISFDKDKKVLAKGYQISP